MKLLRLYTGLLLLFFLTACSQHSLKKTSKVKLPAAKSIEYSSHDIPILSPHLSKQSQQVVLVKTKTWESTQGKLYRYQWNNNNWVFLPPVIPVNVGRNGLAWGQGLHENPVNAKQKQEGDGKAPAGIFKFGDAFGYGQQGLPNMKIKYRVATKRDYYIDDVNHKDYNTWQQIPVTKENSPKKKWKSFEKMLRDDARYEYGLIVKHNTSPVIKGKGSAIFLHVWLNPETMTSGCTAMSKPHMKTLLQWLDPKLNPIFIQTPSTVNKKIN